MANRALAENWAKGLEELPTAEQYKQDGLRNIRAMWSQLVEYCRAVEEPEPDNTQLLELEAEFLNSGEIESYNGHGHKLPGLTS
jgi:hypothetical protein